MPTLAAFPWMMERDRRRRAEAIGSNHEAG
jgi:hypothetical protein